MDDYALGPLGLVKIDVEGHELAVLEGMAGVLDKSRPTLIVEIADRFNRGDGDRIFSLLSDHGYLPYVWNGTNLSLIHAYDHVAVLEMFAGPPKRAHNYIFVHDREVGHVEELL